MFTYEDICLRETAFNPMEVTEHNGTRIFHFNLKSRHHSAIYITSGGNPCSERRYQDIQSGKTDITPFYHAHDCFFLVYVMKGSNLEFIEGQSLLMTEHDLLLLTPYARHHNVFTEGSQVVFFHIETDMFFHAMLPAVMENIIFANFFSDFLSNRYTRKALFLRNRIADTKWILDKLIEEYIAKKDLANSYEQYLLGLLVIELARSQSYQFQDYNEEAGGKIRDVLDYIADNYTDITLAEAASHFGYNPSYLSRKIRETTGRTYSELISDYRLNMAVILIRQGRQSVEEIAFACGYNEVSTFYKAFRRHFGCSPREILVRQSFTSSPSGFPLSPVSS